MLRAGVYLDSPVEYRSCAIGQNPFVEFIAGRFGAGVDDCRVIVYVLFAAADVESLHFTMRMLAFKVLSNLVSVQQRSHRD